MRQFNHFMNGKIQESLRRSSFHYDHIHLECIFDDTKPILVSTPSLAIVILNWNGKHFLEKFLPSVVSASGAGVSIWVADNASTDDSIDFLKQHYPDIHLLHNPINEGFAKGYNTALKQIKADYYVLLNSDVEVAKGWIEPAISMMEADKQIAAVQPKILQYATHQHFEYAGGAGGWIDSLGYPFCMGRIFDHCEEDLGQFDTPQFIFWASGAAMFVRANAFHEAGGFDPFFFAHQEEIDLCWRLQLAGYTIKSCPQSLVFHVGGGTLPKGNEKKVYLNFRNNLIMLSKNLPFAQKLWKIPIRIMLDAVSAWKNVPLGEWQYFRAVFKAHIHWIKWIFIQQNQSNFPKKRSSELHGVYSGSVAWKHFVKGKKLFKEIVTRD